MKTTAKSLRQDTKNILEAVERGEEVIVSKRGRPCARIVPVKRKVTKAALPDHGLYGVWKENKTVDDVNGFIDGLRSGRK